MKLFYDQIETALLDYELFSIIQIESPSLLLQFCNDLFLNLANNYNGPEK